MNIMQAYRVIEQVDASKRANEEIVEIIHSNLPELLNSPILKNIVMKKIVAICTEYERLFSIQVDKSSELDVRYENGSWNIKEFKWIDQKSQEPLEDLLRRANYELMRNAQSITPSEGYTHLMTGSQLYSTQSKKLMPRLYGKIFKILSWPLQMLFKKKPEA